jgi:hypothetical protein
VAITAVRGVEDGVGRLAHVPWSGTGASRAHVTAAQVRDVVTRSPGIPDANGRSRRPVVNASSLIFVVALLVTFVVLHRRLRRQIRRNELSMTYIPW